VDIFFSKVWGARFCFSPLGFLISSDPLFRLLDFLFRVDPVITGYHQGVTGSCGVSGGSNDTSAAIAAREKFLLPVYQQVRGKCGLQCGWTSPRLVWEEESIHTSPILSSRGGGWEIGIAY
jgi:hypothetical protein